LELPTDVTSALEFRAHGLQVLTARRKGKQSDKCSSAARYHIFYS
jgi:hypothetical protein